MLEGNPRIFVQAVLGRLPEVLQLGLLEDAEFRGQLGAVIERTINVDGGAVAFKCLAFFDRVARKHADPRREVLIPDVSGGEWRLTVEDNADRTFLVLSNGAHTFRLLDVPGLRPTSVERVADFERALRLAGLASTDLADWRVRLAERALDAEEILELERSLANTPTAIANTIGAALQSTASLENLVPSAVEYWDRLCGRFEASDLQALATHTSARAAELIRTRGVDGTRQALWLAGEGKLLLDAGIAALPAGELLALAEKLGPTADLLSKVAFVEVALAAVGRVPELVPHVTRITAEVVALEPARRDGPLWLLSALIMMVDGQLTHLNLHPEWPPFRRRQAAIAHASLIAAQWPPDMKSEDFVTWAIEVRSTDFYFQTLVDLFQEPRWSYEHVGPEQLKHEFISRLHNAGSNHVDLINGTPLEALFLGSATGSLISQMQFPGTFLPGPLEGAQAATPKQPPPVVEEVIDEYLGAETLKAGALASLINIRGLFSVADDKITRLMSLIETAGFRLPDDANPDDANALLLGLAGLAAVTRTPALADQVRIMVRRRRVDGQGISFYGELGLALTCAAARIDRRLWAEAFGEWVAELAFATTERRQAVEMHAYLSHICVVSPYLRTTVARSLAALQSFICM